MTNWLEIYRSGKWKDEVGVLNPNINAGQHISWRSPKWGLRRGVVVLTDDSTGWVLVQGVSNLTWISPQRITDYEVGQ